MRTPRVKGYSFSYATKQDYDLAWAKYPYRNPGLDVVSGRVDDPSWRAKVKALVDANHPYSRTIWPAKSSSQPWEVDWTWTWLELFSAKPRTSRMVGSAFFSSLCSTSFVLGISQVDAVETARRQAKLAFLGKVREEQNPFQALPFFGELRETIRMIRHPLSGIIRKNRSATRQFNAIQRLYRSKPARLNDALEKAYLQWTYGVSPLINDIQAVMDSCKRLFEEPVVKRISVTIPIPDGKVASSAYLDNYIEFGTQCIGFHSETVVKGSLRLVGALKHVKSPASPEKFRELNGLRVRDIVPAAWELAPYSFLVDYFVNLGDVIGGVFTDTSGLVYTCESVRLRQSTRGFLVPLPYDGCVGWPVSPVSGNVDKISLNRDTPSLLVGIRDISWQDTTVGQWINTAILSSQRLRSAALGR